LHGQRQPVQVNDYQGCSAFWPFWRLQARPILATGAKVRRGQNELSVQARAKRFLHSPVILTFEGFQLEPLSAAF